MIPAPGFRRTVTVASSMSVSFFAFVTAGFETTGFFAGFFDAFALSLAVIRVTFVADLDFFDVATLD